MSRVQVAREKLAMQSDKLVGASSRLQQGAARLLKLNADVRGCGVPLGNGCDSGAEAGEGAAKTQAVDSVRVRYEPCAVLGTLV